MQLLALPLLLLLLLFVIGVERLSSGKFTYPQRIPIISKKPRQKIEIPLNCTALPRVPTISDGSTKITGISRDMINRARRTANFKLVIVNGKAYVETFQKAFQTRDIPDLELMFDCVDWPVVLSKAYSGPNASAPPPLFRYCADDKTLDIVFPDWSFWGWPETNIKPWEALLEELKEGNKRSKWVQREAYTYWKGNPIVAETRQDLLKCNVSDKQDWGARLYAQHPLLGVVGEAEVSYSPILFENQSPNDCPKTSSIAKYYDKTAQSIEHNYLLRDRSF
ncbi:hypothetical protein UlMin_024597 [Ulmus minor]